MNSEIKFSENEQNIKKYKIFNYWQIALFFHLYVSVMFLSTNDIFMYTSKQIKNYLI